MKVKELIEMLTKVKDQEQEIFMAKTGGIGSVATPGSVIQAKHSFFGKVTPCIIIDDLGLPARRNYDKDDLVVAAIYDEEDYHLFDENNLPRPGVK